MKINLSSLNPERVFVLSVATLVIVTILGLVTKAKTLFVISDILMVFIVIFALIALVWSLIKRSKSPVQAAPPPPDHPSES